MSNILMVQDSQSEHFDHMRKSLMDHHRLQVADDINAAMNILQQFDSDIDLIIATVHDSTTDIFQFMQTVKAEPLSRDIPFLCFSAERSLKATFLDQTLSASAQMCGADSYLSMDSFCFASECGSCKSCSQPEHGCDYSSLRSAVEMAISR